MLHRPPTSNIPHQWTEQDEADLRKLWGDGYSASHVARLMGRGLTRNSIIGKVHRLNLPTRTVTMSQHQRSAMGRAAAQSIKAKRPNNGKGQPKPQAIAARLAGPAFETVPLPEEEMGNDVTHLVGIMDLKAHDCRWIEGDPLNVHGYCGKRAREDSSYCTEHHARVYMGYSR